MAEEKTCDKMGQESACCCEVDKAKAKEKLRVDTSNFTVEDQKLFLQGWKEAGGFMGDMHTESPFCAPWSRDEIVELDGEDPVKWGRDYWEEKKEELVNAALLEAFDHVQGTIATALAGSMVMSEVGNTELLGTPHKVVTPAFDPKELPEPLAIFATSTVSLTAEEAKKIAATKLASLKAELGRDPIKVKLYVFTDGSGLIKEEDNYVALTQEETSQTRHLLVER